MSNEYWVYPENFDVSLLSLETNPIKNTQRHRLMYAYPDGIVKKLQLTFPRDEEAYAYIGSPTKKPGKKTNGEVFTPTKYSCSLTFDMSNRYHYAWMAVMGQIYSFIQQKLNKKPIMKFIPKENKYIMYASLIEDADGKIYTPFYTDSEYINPLEVKRSVGRPCVGFSVNTQTGKIGPQLEGVFCSKFVDNFFLATRD